MRCVKCVSLYCFNFCLHFRHPTSCCSIAEILSVLFFHTMRYKGKFCEQNKVKKKCDQNIETCRNIYRYGYSFFEIRQYTRWKSSLLSITIREKTETRVLKSEIHNLQQPERLNFNIKSEHTSQPRDVDGKSYFVFNIHAWLNKKCCPNYSIALSLRL